MYENLIILEILKQFLNKGRQPDFYFYRDTHGNEVDLIIRTGRRLIPLEIKSAATFTKEFLKGIERFKNAAGERCENGYVIYNGTEEFNIKGNKILNIFIQQGMDKLGVI